MDETRKKYTAGQWLDTAVGKIRFKPDRKQVRKELEEHIEDKAFDLLRFFPDLMPSQAWDRAANEMGDPEELSRELGQLYRPWLGYAWRASQMVLAAVLLGLGLYLAGWVRDLDQWRRYELPRLEEGVPFASEPVTVGDYTLWAEGRWLPESAGGYAPLAEGAGTLYLVWHAESSRFWERPTTCYYWRGEDDLGNWYGRYDGGLFLVTGQNLDPEVPPLQVVSALSWDGVWPSWAGEQTVWLVPEEARWVELTMDLGDEPVTVRLERKEGAA